MAQTEADILKGVFTSYRAKLAADNGKSDILETLSLAEKRLSAKSLLGEAVDDSTVASIAADAMTKITEYNEQVQLPQLDLTELQAALAAVADPE